MCLHTLCYRDTLMGDWTVRLVQLFPRVDVECLHLLIPFN